MLLSSLDGTPLGCAGHHWLPCTIMSLVGVVVRAAHVTWWLARGSLDSPPCLLWPWCAYKKGRYPPPSGATLHVRIPTIFAPKLFCFLSAQPPGLEWCGLRGLEMMKRNKEGGGVVYTSDLGWSTMTERVLRALIDEAGLTERGSPERRRCRPSLMPASRSRVCRWSRGSFSCTMWSLRS